jgi:hypothetical protein
LRTGSHAKTAKFVEMAAILGWPGAC